MYSSQTCTEAVQICEEIVKNHPTKHEEISPQRINIFFHFENKKIFLLKWKTINFFVLI